MIRIAFFSGDITRSGGTERVSILIANHLALKERFEIHFVSLWEEKTLPFFGMNGRITRHRLSDRRLSPGVGGPLYIRRLRRFLRQQEIDLIIDIDTVLDVISVPAARRLHTKVLSWENFNYQYETARLYRRMILQRYTKRADVIVTLTPGDRDTFCRELHRTSGVRSIYNPIKEMEYVATTHREKWIITSAQLVYRKGFDYLCKVAGQVLPRHPDWKWLILGEGPEREAIEAYCLENHLEGQLVLEGLVEHVEKYLVRASIFVLTSREEGLPMCLLEARTYGVPAVSFDIQTGPRDIITDGVNGYLVEPFDIAQMAEKLERLMEDEALRQRMGDEAKKNLKAFMLPDIVRQWSELIEEICG